MRSSNLFVFGLLLVLLAVATSGYRHPHHRSHRTDYKYYYPEEVRDRYEQRQEYNNQPKYRHSYPSAGESVFSSADYHKEYLKSLGGQEGSHQAERELLKNKMKKGKRYN